MRPGPLEGDESDEEEGSRSLDPLSQMAAEVEAGGGAVGGGAAGGLADDSFEPWAMKRTVRSPPPASRGLRADAGAQGILSRYTTNAKLCIQGAPQGGSAKVVVQGTVGDMVKSRLEQLDDEGNLQEMKDLNQADYIKRIEELNAELRRAWEGEQRVKALKIAIQCAKLLADTSVIEFYPSKFVLITDILDTFGQLVAERIRTKSSYYPPGSSVAKELPEDFTVDMVPASAKETCRNWFFKIASIRELIPRLYVEAAILKCYSFLLEGEYKAAMERLTMMMRGIGDPLVAAYARCYLCRVGVLVAPDIRSHLHSNFSDFMHTYAQIENPTVASQMAAEKVDMAQYLRLYIPAVDWILQCLSHRAPEAVLDRILTACRESLNVSLLINARFPPKAHLLHEELCPLRVLLRHLLGLDGRGVLLAEPEVRLPGEKTDELGRVRPEKKGGGAGKKTAAGRSGQDRG